MQESDFTVGTRVRLTRKVGGIYPGAMYNIAPGPVGTVIEVNPEAAEDYGEPFAKVRFDERIEDLDDWDNELHVTKADGDAILSDFEVIPCA